MDPRMVASLTLSRPSGVHSADLTGGFTLKYLCRKPESIVVI
jgi:hypothetical protein